MDGSARIVCRSDEETRVDDALNEETEHIIHELRPEWELLRAVVLLEELLDCPSLGFEEASDFGLFHRHVLDYTSQRGGCTTDTHAICPHLLLE